MRKLDRSKPFGKISPPYEHEDFDRPAFYEQDGLFFDQHDREIVPGQPLEQIVPHTPGPVTKDEEAKAVEKLSPVELLRQADTMPWAQFRKQAKLIFGANCPATKQEIKIALQEAIAGYQARQEARMARAANVEPGQSAETDASPKQPAQAAPQAKSTGVDLAAWARGKKEYLFGDIRKAIKAQYHRVVTERRDALDLLIEQGVVTAESARRDIQ